MKNPIFYLIILTNCLSCNHSKRQTQKEVKDFGQKIQELVLSENTIGQEFIFKINKSPYILEYNMTYLGNLNKLKYKVLYYEVLNGNEDAPQLNCYLSFFDTQGLKIGKFYIGSLGMPELKDDNLIFNQIYGDCNQITTISFREGIPKEIFIHCKEEKGEMSGDIYSFVPDK
ncbi:hypothetical protein [Emticicia agri]|uniref:Uncharacterized protein n=1 Tax=Emticicia agri TaxID=2492393 RepID=A0A4Q5LNV5_9BACT|nr:hypothetical protein [Emticicia agri]RYU91058.1 hypothetical protein EWM59_27050 [Emticicia agri]